MGADRLEDLPLDKLVIGKSQVRISQVGKGIAELAASIAKQGLLEPITVVASEDQPGKYEIIAGQRRFLAHKELNRDTIRAVVRDEKVSETDKKVISLTENMLREDPPAADYILACTEL